MIKLHHITKVAAIGAITLLFAPAVAAAQYGDRPLAMRPAIAPTPNIAASPAKPAERKRSTLGRMTPSRATKSKEHRLILQVNTNDAAAMNLALNNAMNVTQYYKGLGEKVKIEVVTFGPGLHMLREDTSPVKARIETMALSTPQVSFKACGNTRENMHKAENKDIPIIAQAQVVKSGVVHVMQLEEQGWTYVKP